MRRSKSAKANGDTNEIVIGYNTTGNGSNTATIGNTSITDVYMGGTGGAIVNAGGYKSSDGTAGMTGTKIFNDGEVVNTVVIKNGLITS